MHFGNRWKMPRKENYMSAKAERARNLRYKRPALAMLGYELILNELYDICSECETIRYA